MDNRPGLKRKKEVVVAMINCNCSYVTQRGLERGV